MLLRIAFKNSNRFTLRISLLQFIKTAHHPLESTGTLTVKAPKGY